MTDRGTVRKVLLPLARALAGGHRAWIRHDDGGGVHSSRQVEVLGLGFRDGGWVVAAFCHRRRAFRLFRLDRIARARVLPSRARPGLAPRGFDPGFFASSGFLRAGTGGPPARATVRLRPPLRPLAGALFPSATRRTGPGGAVLCHLRATEPLALERLVATLGRGAELARPTRAGTVDRTAGRRSG